ncbi:MAG: hypothetical protein ACOH2D_03015 [Gelidibacter sp.]|uniref:hypothetical protein n=1 Tax=Gelidibacter sp. TaxID=2018083 RepID=UPI003267CB6D
MKTKLLMAIPILCFLLMSVKPFPLNAPALYDTAQDSNIIGVYDGNEGYGYNFITQHKDNGSDFTMTFQKVDDAVMKEFDLEGELFVNQKFEVTYNVKIVKSKDEDGFDQEDEIYTITHLKKL